MQIVNEKKFEVGEERVEEREVVDGGGGALRILIYIPTLGMDHFSHN